MAVQTQTKPQTQSRSACSNHSDVKPFYMLGQTALHQAVQAAVKTGVHSQAHKTLMEENGGLLNPQYQGPRFGFKTGNPYEQPKRDWGAFRAPIRDFQAVMNRVSKGVEQVTVDALDAYIDACNDAMNQGDDLSYELQIAQLLRVHFDTLRAFGPASRFEVVNFHNLVALAEGVSEYYERNKARKDNPYVLGLSDTDFEVAARLMF